jgi:hypothetical protein
MSLPYEMIMFPYEKLEVSALIETGVKKYTFQSSVIEVTYSIIKDLTLSAGRFTVR